MKLSGALVDLAALTDLACSTLVTAAVTDAWEGLRRQLADLLGRAQADPSLRRRLDATREALVAASGPELQGAQGAEMVRWRTRFADLLDDRPDIADQLLAVVEEARRTLSLDGVLAADHSLAAGRDANLEAWDGGVTAGVIHGNVAIQHGPAGLAAAYGSGLAAEAGPEATRLPVKLPPRPLVLAGREDLLHSLHAQLAGEEQPSTVVLCGLGGAGKTSVAAEYAHRHLAELGVAWLVAADDAAVLAVELRELAAQLGAWEAGDTRDPVTSLHAALAAFPQDWLLVFDDASDAAAVQRFLPPAGRGRVLITSLNPHWPAAHVHEVEVLPIDVAAGFLMSRTGDADEAAAAELATTMGGLPLALEQAAAYIQATAGTLAGYSRLFLQRRDDLLKRGEVTTVATTLTLALNRLHDRFPAAVGLLRLLAFLAPEPVPVEMLMPAGSLPTELAFVQRSLPRDALALADAIASLRRYSLLTIVGPEMVAVHRLVQAVTVAQINQEEIAEWQHAAGALTEVAIPAETVLPAIWPTCAALFPHAQAALGAEAPGMARLALYLKSSGSYAAARDLQRRVVEASSHLAGPDDPETLTARVNLAEWTGEAGDSATARDMLAALLPELHQVHGPEHPTALTARRYLARFTGQTGDAAAARDLLITLLPEFERVNGADHPDTLMTRSSLAEWTGESGDAVAARDLYADLLPDYERVLGPDHPATLIDRANLAGWTGATGDVATARDLYAELALAYQRTLGPNHPTTLVVRGNLACFTGEAGEPAAARDMLLTLVPRFEGTLGTDHPYTLITRAGLARFTGLAGDPHKALELLAALLPHCERVFGPAHPETLRCRARAIEITGIAGDPATARDLSAELLRNCERILGAEHPLTLAVRAGLTRFSAETSDKTYTGTGRRS